MAIAMKNVSIGYYQVFNFIVDKLLIIIENEEEIFWFLIFIYNLLELELILKLFKKLFI